MSCLGRTYTEVPDARDPREFLAGLRAGRGNVAGESGNYWKLTRAIWEIGNSLIRERRAAALLSPLMALIPAITLANFALELTFAWTWKRRIVKNLRTARSAPIAVPSVIPTS
jgi:hypothetical protein